jgi:hypothetical protein
MRSAVMALCAVLQWPASSATTNLVRPDGSGDFPTIQAAQDLQGLQKSECGW